MEPTESLPDVLGRFMSRGGYSTGQLSRLSGLPKQTIVNWLAGHVQRPRSWHGLVQLAAALHLDEAEATQLLQAANHPSIVELIAQSDDKRDRALLAPWAKAVRQRFAKAPFQAIADLPHFVGRESELQDLERALLDPHGPKLLSIQGMGGMGKTALAAHAAYQMRPHFPDGVLWARVDTSDPMSILSTFASAYEQDVSQYGDLDSRSRVVRELLADKRALVVLDNVWSSRQVKSLLPPTGTCAVIITTRRHDLSITRGAHRLHIGPFRRQEEILNLFSRALGAKAVQRDRATLLEIAELLGYLPLAVDIVASRMAYEPGWSAVDFAKRLRREKKRLDELAYEDLDVRLSIGLSYESLRPAQQQFFAALGAFRGDDLSIAAAAHVMAIPLEDAEDVLRNLYVLSLVQQARPGRYRLHPLLSDYAREWIQDESVYERMVEFYVRYVETHEREHDALSLEIDNVFAALRTAKEQRMALALVRGTNALYNYLETRGLYSLAESYLDQALQAARELGDAAHLISTLRNSGWTQLRRGDYPLAEAFFQEGLAWTREIGDVGGTCALLQGMGMVATRHGEYAQAEAYYQEGLTLARETGDHEQISALLSGLGAVVSNRGDTALAESYLLEGLTLAREIGARERMSNLLASLGAAAIRHGDYVQAKSYLLEGLALAREMRNHTIIVPLLLNLGWITGLHGNYAQAEEHYREALAQAREMGERWLTSVLLTNLGIMASKRGDHASAEAYHLEGLALAREIGEAERISVSLQELGVTQALRGDCTLAKEYLGESLALAREMEHPERVGESLCALGEVLTRCGELAQAAECLGESLALARKFGYRQIVSEASNVLGTLALARNEPEAASDSFREALEIARELGTPEDTALALYGLARVAKARGALSQARCRGTDSLTILEAIGHRQAAQVKQWLRDL